MKDERNWISYWQLYSEAFWEQDTSFRMSYFLMSRHEHVTHITAQASNTWYLAGRDLRGWFGRRTQVRCLMIDASANSKLRKKTCSVFERVSQLRTLSAFFKGFRRLAKAEIHDFTHSRSAIKLSFNKQHSLVSAWRYTDRRDTLCFTLPGLLVFVSMLLFYSITDNRLIILFQCICDFGSVNSFQNLGNEPFEFKLLGRNKLYCSL